MLLQSVFTNSLAHVYSVIPCKRHKYYPHFTGVKIKAMMCSNLVMVLKGNYFGLAALNSCNLSHFLTVDES